MPKTTNDNPVNAIGCDVSSTYEIVSDWSRARSSCSAISADASEIADETAEHETSRANLEPARET